MYSQLFIYIVLSIHLYSPLWYLFLISRRYLVRIRKAGRLESLITIIWRIMPICR